MSILPQFIALLRSDSMSSSGAIESVFPEDFAFQLTAEEYEGLRSQIATLEESRPGGSTNWSQIATLKRGRGQHRKYRPWAFTEHGALQVANILRSDRAIAMSVYVIRAFIELREKLLQMPRP